MLKCLINSMVMACMFVFTLEENVAKFVEDIEVVDQGFQVHEKVEQGKLPPYLQTMLISSIKFTYQNFLGKE